MHLFPSTLSSLAASTRLPSQTATPVPVRTTTMIRFCSLLRYKTPNPVTQKELWIFFSAVQMKVNMEGYLHYTLGTSQPNPAGDLRLRSCLVVSSMLFWWCNHQSCCFCIIFKEQLSLVCCKSRGFHRIVMLQTLWSVTFFSLFRACSFASCFHVPKLTCIYRS